MSLSDFSVVVAVDSKNGIAKDGDIPWQNYTNQKFFKDTTIGKGRNVVVFGRITYESIPEKSRPLPGRHNVVVSRTWDQYQNPDITVCSSLLDALTTIGGTISKYDDIFIIGGEHLFNEAISNFMYLCKRVYVTKFKANYDCDQFFPWDAVKDFPPFQKPQKTRDYMRYTYSPQIKHDEYTYLDLLKHISDTGESKPDDLGIGIVSKFGISLIFDLTERLPIITTRYINVERIIKEILFYVSGKTDFKDLGEEHISMAKDCASERCLDYEEGDIGPGYGFQWRYWNAEYDGFDTDYTNKGIDQLQNLIKNIRENPHTNQHIINSWNVLQLEDMVFPPQEINIQFCVSGDGRFLDCLVCLTHGDMFSSVQRSITIFSLFVCMIAHITNLKPRKICFSIGNAFIYRNCGDQIKKQINRTPKPFPKLSFRKASRICEIDDFEFDSFVIEGYESWPHISIK